MTATCDATWNGSPESLMGCLSCRFKRGNPQRDEEAETKVGAITQSQRALNFLLELKGEELLF